MRSRRFRVTSTLLALLAAFALVAGACSSDKDDSSDGGDTKSDDSGSANDSDPNSTDGGGDTDTSDEGDGENVPTGDFSEIVDAAIAEVNNAADACDLYGAVSTLSTSVGNPTTKDEVELAVGFYVAMLTKMSETSSNPDTAATLKTGAADFQAYAESVDYDPEKMDLDGAGPDVANSQELDTAMNDYATTEFLECEDLAGATPPGAVDPGAQPEG